MSVGVRILDNHTRNRKVRVSSHRWRPRAVNERLAFVGIANLGFVDLRSRSCFAVNRAEAYTYLDYKDFDYEQSRFFEEPLMTSLMPLSAVSPGKASTLDIDLCSRFSENT